jgi:hypothetical protein
LSFDSVQDDIRISRELLLTGPALSHYGGMVAPVRHYLADGKVKTTMYLAREGGIEVFE